MHCNNNPVNKVDSDGRFAAVAGSVYFVPGVVEVAIIVTVGAIGVYGVYKAVSWAYKKLRMLELMVISIKFINRKG
ncbi:hypothetical protein [Clostridium acetobutylicum]|uniref:hypothetical protein n=1 Tax=Clostridium acetobutylicum TaxID=1488 RepID=UPI0002E40080|nr:hypothetical protein [Clostridium acetobutylicum]